jgi:hypothetical protein
MVNVQLNDSRSVNKRTLAIFPVSHPLLGPFFPTTVG